MGLDAGRPNDVGERRDRVGVDWDAGEHHPGEASGRDLASATPANARIIQPAR